MSETRRPLKRAAIHGQNAAEAKGHAEDIHRQLIDQVVPAVMEVVGTIVSDPQERGANGQHDEATEEEQMKKCAERLLMDTLLRQCISHKPSNPNPPIALKSAWPAFPPKPHMAHDLPNDRADARRDHDKEYHLHPRRDIAENFARSVVHVRRRWHFWLKLCESLR